MTSKINQTRYTRHTPQNGGARTDPDSGKYHRMVVTYRFSGAVQASLRACNRSSRAEAQPADHPLCSSPTERYVYDKLASRENNKQIFCLYSA